MEITSNKKIIIYAPGVHVGGGERLLSSLLDKVPSESVKMVIVDHRFPSQSYAHIPVEKVKRIKRFSQRIFTEWSFKREKEDTIILCFSNLPPLFKVKKAFVNVFFQNISIIEESGFKNSLRRRLIKKGAKFVDRFIVQTNFSRKALLKLFKKKSDVNIEIKPFMYKVRNQNIGAKEFDFIYPSVLKPHKNFRVLIRAWIQLAKKGQYPSLVLTIPEDEKEFLKAIEKAIEQNKLKIFNIGYVEHKKLVETMVKTKAIVFPSLYESFGLPLAEAVQLGLPILAAEDPYIYDIVQPSATFKKVSGTKLAEAVESFSYKPATLNRGILSTEQFVTYLFEPVVDLGAKTVVQSVG